MNHLCRIIIFMCTYSALESKQIMQFSIPKCGSHLLGKCITELTQRKGVSEGPDDIKLKRDGTHYTVTDRDFYYFTHLPSNQFWLHHLIPTPQYIDKLINHNNYAIFFIYRDPRDQVVSFMYHVRKIETKNKRPFYKPEVFQMSDDELLMALIKECDIHPTKNHISCSGTRNLYNTYLTWMNVPGVYSLKFEDLIGPKGGGSARAQFNEIRNIALHIGLSPDDILIEKVISRIFGNSSTFRAGKIGAWKTHFTDKHKEIFKDVAGQLLIDLGYEKDFLW